jgi:hypothetical protein
VLTILAGLPCLILMVRIFLEPGFAVRDAPVGSGIAVLFVGLVTVAAWVTRIATGKAEPPRRLRLFGTGALAVAVTTGAWLLIGQITEVIEVASSGRIGPQ